MQMGGQCSAAQQPVSTHASPPARSPHAAGPLLTHTSAALCVQASGAGDGVIRLWALADAKGGSSKALQPLGGLPARGFVNAMAIARSGRFVVAGMGQEPRMGRWLRDAAARNGLLVHPLPLRDEA